MSPGDLVRGKVVRAEEHKGWFVRLDEPDIEVWLPESGVPWRDGSLADEPRHLGIKRLELEVGDRVRGAISKVNMPPERPSISLRRYLARLERENEFFMVSPRTTSPLLELRHRARFDPTALDALRLQLGGVQRLAGKRILLADDNALSLQSLSLLLRTHGAEIATVHVRESLSLAADEIAKHLQLGSDLVLLDYSLPGRGEGLTLAHRLRQKNPNCPAIVIYSGDRLARSDIPENPTEIQGLLHKPLYLKSLLAVLDGHAVWEYDETEAIDLTSRELLTAPLATPAQLLRYWFKSYRLRYLVLLEYTHPDKPTVIAREGVFPDGGGLSKLLSYTEIRHVSSGSIGKFETSSGDAANEKLHAYSQHTRFAAVGESKPPRFLFGAGWDGALPFAEEEYRTFLLLLEMRLEQQALWDWLQAQLPFLVQGQIMSGLGHEVRARFAPWLQYQQTLKAAWRAHQDGSPEKRQAMAVIVEESLQGMEQAYGGLHELMELMLGGLRQRRAKSHVGEILGQLHQLFEPQLRQRGIRLVLGETLLLTLDFPPLYLFQSISNLILNAEKHMHRESGGLVRIEATLDEIDGRTWLAVDVSDNGPGIATHVQPEIFRPGYSQAPCEEDRTGMGLFVSRLLLKQVNGAVELAETWRGEGSRFRVWLPLVLSGEEK